VPMRLPLRLLLLHRPLYELVKAVRNVVEWQDWNLLPLIPNKVRY
jgi:hypothetical protein